MKENNFEDFQSIDQLEKISFQEFIDSKKFSASITNYLNAIAMGSNSSQSALEVIKNFPKTRQMQKLTSLNLLIFYSFYYFIKNKS